MIAMFFSYSVLFAEEPIIKFIVQDNIMHNVNTLLSEGGQYYAECNLKLFKEPGLSLEVGTMLKAGISVSVIRIGDEVTVGTIKSKWVKIKTGPDVSGWCFGGYLSSPVKLKPGYYLNERFNAKAGLDIHAKKDHFNRVDRRSPASSYYLLFGFIEEYRAVISYNHKIVAFHTDYRDMLYIYNGETGIMKSIDLELHDRFGISDDGNSLLYLVKTEGNMPDIVAYDLENQKVLNVLHKAGGADLDPSKEIVIIMNYHSERNQFGLEIYYNATPSSEYLVNYNIENNVFSVENNYGSPDWR